MTDQARIEVESTWASPVDFDHFGTIYFPRNAPPATSLESREETFEEAYPLRGRIGDQEFPAEPNRYHLYASLACPYAHRSLITRRLKGLEDVIGISIVDPLRDGRGWAFRDVEGSTADRGGGGFTLLRQAYDATVGGTYRHRISVPVLWDTRSQRIVSNHYPDIPRLLNSAFDEWATHPGLDLYPAELTEEIVRAENWIAAAINSGVYTAGFARTQSDYEVAATRVFETFDSLEERLDGHAFLVGDTLTGADLNLWVSLIRFEPVYRPHFKLTKRSLRDHPNLLEYTRRLYRIPAFAETTNFTHIVRHYYGTQLHINPSGIVPLDVDQPWLEE